MASVTTGAAYATAMWALLAFGCGGAPPPEAEAPPSPAATAEPEAPPDGHLDRARLEVVLRQGPPWLLQRVPIEEVLEGGKFIGWRVRHIPEEWGEIELREGDVVTAINAMPVETPTDMWAAWTTLGVASELQVAYLRDGESRELSVPIFGSPNPNLANSLDRAPDPAAPPQESPVQANQRYNEAKRHDTIVIKSNDRPLSDTIVDWLE